MALLFILGILGGVFTFIQTTINSRLRGHVDSPYLSSLISFIMGTVLLGVITFVSGGSLLPTPEQLSLTPWWTYIGGFIGVVVMTIYILLFPILGGVQTVAMPIFGQIIMSILIDAFGWFGVTRQAMSVWNMAGVIVLIIGVFAIVMLPDHLASRDHTKATEKNTHAWQFVAVMAGMILAVQVAANGNLGMRLQSPVQSAFLSLAIGTIILLVINIRQKSWQKAAVFRKKKAPAWIWCGGIFGALYIYLNAFLAPKIGTGSVVVFALIGQMTTSLIVDSFGLLGAPRRKVTAVQIAGLAIMLIGVAVIKLV